MLVNRTIVLGVCLFAKTAFGGFGVGRGGDALFCSSLHNMVNQYVSLDYALTVNIGDELISTENDSLASILSLLEDAAPNLQRSLGRFLAFRSNSDDYNRDVIWIPAPSQLIDIRDEDLSDSTIPSGCNQRQMVQAIIRTMSDLLVTYHYDQVLLEDLKHNAPRQYSFLMIHEWLWELTEDVRVVRLVNRFLHLKSTHLLSPVEIRTALHRMTISVDGPVFQDVCDRSPALVSALESSLGSACSGISYDLLHQWAQPYEYRDPILGTRLAGAEIHVKDVDILSPLDFSGLEQLYYLRIEHGGLTEIPPGVFSPLTALRWLWIRLPLDNFLENTLHSNSALTNLKINSTNLSSLPDYVFRSLGKLETLDLFDNKLEYVGTSWFDFSSALISLNLGQNRISGLHGPEFSYLPKLKTLALNSNSIQVIPNDLFRHNRELQSVSLSNNRVRELPRDLFINNPKLDTLRLSNNLLQTIPDGLLARSKTLKYLDFSHNKIRYIGAGNLNHPAILSFEHNLLSEFPPFELANSDNNDGNLHFVYLANYSHNLIQRFPAPALKSVAFDVLNLESNQIELSLDESDYAQILIRDLNLSGNRIREIPSAFWRLFSQCNTSERCSIDLRNNPISDATKVDLETRVSSGIPIDVFFDR